MTEGAGGAVPRSSIRSWARSVSQVQKWWASKIGPLLAVTFVALILRPVPVGDALLRSGAMIWSASMLATAAYVVNDWFDREVDEAIGKRSAAMSMSPATVVALYVLLLVLGIGPWVALGLTGAGWAALGAIVVLPFLYSMPPLRWKTRGGLGLVADAGLAHVAPTTFALAAFGAFDELGATWSSVVACGAVAWSTGLGFRSIISHEIVDLPSDQLAGVATWVGDVGVPRATRIGGWVAFPIELLGLLAMGFGLVPTTALPLVLFAITGAAMVLARSVGAWPVPLLAVFTPDHDRAVLFLFYRFWLGATFLAGLVMIDRSYLIMVPVYLAMFLAVARDEARSLIGGVRGTVRGSGWIVWGRVLRPSYHKVRYRFVPAVRDRWRASVVNITALRGRAGAAIAAGFRATCEAVAASTSAVVGGGRSAGRSVRAGARAFSAFVARTVTAAGAAAATSWAEIRRFVWRAWRKCRRTVLAVVRSER